MSALSIEAVPVSSARRSLGAGFKRGEVKYGGRDDAGSGTLPAPDAISILSVVKFLSTPLERDYNTS